MELPSQAHWIAAPLVTSELESLQGLWVTEKNEFALASEYLTSSAPLTVILARTRQNAPESRRFR